MPILQRYITKEVCRFFAIVLVSVLSIYLIVDFFERVDNYISSGVEITKAVSIFLFNLPLVMMQVIPLCLLLSVLVALGLMNRNNEIIAIKSSGLSVFYILKPILMIGVCFTLTIAVLSEILVPLTVPKANKIWIEDVKKKQMVTTLEKNIWIKGDHLITHIKRYDPVNETIFGLSLYFFDKKFNLMDRIDAEKGVFEKGSWRLYDILEQIRSEKGNPYKVNVVEERVQKLAIMPDDLQHAARVPEEMTFLELNHYIQKVQKEGYDATIYKVDLYAKTAMPFVCLLMSLLGTGIAVRREMREGLPVGIAYGIGIAFLYWVFNSFCLSLGYGGLLTPIISAWLTNFVFLCWSIYLLLNLN